MVAQRWRRWRDRAGRNCAKDNVDVIVPWSALASKPSTSIFMSGTGRCFVGIDSPLCFPSVLDAPPWVLQKAARLWSMVVMSTLNRPVVIVNADDRLPGSARVDKPGESVWTALQPHFLDTTPSKVQKR